MSLATAIKSEQVEADWVSPPVSYDKGAGKWLPPSLLLSLLSDIFLSSLTIRNTISGGARSHEVRNMESEVWVYPFYSSNYLPTHFLHLPLHP